MPKKPKPTLKQRLILRYMAQENMDAVQAAQAADRFIELAKQADNN